MARFELCHTQIEESLRRAGILLDCPPKLLARFCVFLLLEQVDSSVERGIGLGSVRGGSLTAPGKGHQPEVRDYHKKGAQSHGVIITSTESNYRGKSS